MAPIVGLDIPRYAYLEGYLLLVGWPVYLVHREDVRNIIGSKYVIQSVEVNASSGAAAQVYAYLQGGFL